MSERETVVELPWAADCCPCVGKLRTVLPLTVVVSETVRCTCMRVESVGCFVRWLANLTSLGRAVHSPPRRDRRHDGAGHGTAHLQMLFTQLEAEAESSCVHTEPGSRHPAHRQTETEVRVRASRGLSGWYSVVRSCVTRLRRLLCRLESNLPAIFQPRALASGDDAEAYEHAGVGTYAETHSLAVW
jgi:hypothetical protein